jgi:hypothetical protein
MRPRDPDCSGTCDYSDTFVVHDTDCGIPEDMQLTTSLEDTGCCPLHRPHTDRSGCAACSPHPSRRVQQRAVQQLLPAQIRGAA